jgi:hypothetical protein
MVSLVLTNTLQEVYLAAYAEKFKGRQHQQKVGCREMLVLFLDVLDGARGSASLGSFSNVTCSISYC